MRNAEIPMSFVSVNPASGITASTTACWNRERWELALQDTMTAARHWSRVPLEQRASLLHKAAGAFRAQREPLARLITLEMGKLLREARAEIDKCAWGCDYFAEHGPAFLADEQVVTDAVRSTVRYEPLGPVLGVMPWNFPLWQAIRAAAPLLLAGNTFVFKHSSNVPRCALALESVFADAGFPRGVVSTLLISATQVHDVIRDARIRGVTLTGSEDAGRRVAATAGAALKKSVLELGGSDAFIVLADADLEFTLPHALTARFQNAGQSCIAAKRFIVVDAVADAFVQRFAARIAALAPGDPLHDATTLAPLARADLRVLLHEQVTTSIARGAVCITGGAPLPGDGFFYAPSLLDHATPGMPAFDAELFGPVAVVVRARDEQHAIELANASRFGLSASLWTRDIARAETLAGQMETGMVFINAVVKSDPRLPFGGIKDSGYGRELGTQGLREFVNVKTLWIEPAP